MTRRGRQRQAERAGALVGDLLARLGVAGAVREQRLITQWESIVGPRVASRARPDGLERGVLYVRVSNSAWMHELAFLREAMIEAARRVTGDPPLVKEIRFHLGRRRDAGDGDAVAALAAARPRPRSRPAPPAPVDEATRADIDRQTAGVADRELREVIREAWKRLPPRAR
jgi:predicted nucleic acid-binding Zn ribbon protein